MAVSSRGDGFIPIAETLIRSLRPKRVFDAGCAGSPFIEAFRDRGVEACRAASPAQPIEGFYDLITCIDALDRLPDEEAEEAIRNLCRAADAILFSPAQNAHPALYWLERFSEQGFAPDPAYDASFVSPRAFLLRRRYGRLPAVALALFSEKLRLQAELSAQRQQLENVYASPGWRLVQKYRNRLRAVRERRPWLLKLIEPVAARFFQGLDEEPVSLIGEASRDGIPPVPAHIASARLESAAGCAYADWIAEQEPDESELSTQREQSAAFAYQPRISIIVPIYKVPFAILKEMAASVLGQTYDNWELCLAHADPAAVEARRYLASLAETDRRIKVCLLPENLGISANSNRALALATGEFIALLDHDDMLAPFALFEVVKALNREPAIDFLYSDRDEIQQVGDAIRRVNPLLKPQWSPEILLSANYLTHFSVIAAKHVQAIGGWREEMDGAQDWELFLRAIGRGGNVHHIPKILYHWRQVGTSIAGGGLAAKPYAEGAQLRTVRDHCRRQGWDADAVFDVHRRLRILWKPQPQQTISVIFVSTAADGGASSCATQLPIAGAFVPAEMILPVASEIAPEDPRIRVVRVPAEASLAEKLNCAVEHSTGEILVFIDQAVSPAEENWLGELAGPFVNKEIGIVGAKLLEPDTTVRHAGIVFTEANRLEYVFAGGAEDVDAEFGSPTWYRDWSAVSGACFSVRREVWNAAGGLSTAPRYPRLDVELCLKARAQTGLRVAYNPHARFFQSEPAALESWVRTIGEEAADSFIRESLPGGDPYFHAKLTCMDGGVRLRSRGLASHNRKSGASG